MENSMDKWGRCFMRYIIFGAADVGCEALVYLGPARVECFCDNYRAETEVEMKKVVSFDCMSEMYKEGNYIIVIAVRKEETIQAICSQLIDNGIFRCFVFRLSELYDGFDHVLPSYAIYRILQTMSYTRVLSYFQIEKYLHIVIYGVNKYLPYLISEICMQCDDFTIDYIIDEETKEDCYMGIPVLHQLNISDQTDCLLIIKRRSESDVREYLPHDRNYKLVDLFDIFPFITEYGHPELSQFKNIYEGKRCFIIGNGPSLSIQDLDVLHEHGEICFGVNKIYLAFYETAWRPDYLCVSDPNMISVCDPYIDRSIYKTVFYVDDYHWTQNKKVEGVEYIHLIQDDYGNNYPGFSDDITKGVFWGFSVVYDICLQLAAYMGFSEIYFLGVDHSFTKDVTDIKNHFSPTYYNEEDRKLYRKYNMTDARREMISRAYEKAEIYSRTHGFRIYNATRGGKLEAFERIEFDSLF